MGFVRLYQEEPEKRQAEVQAAEEAPSAGSSFPVDSEDIGRISKELSERTAQGVQQIERVKRAIEQIASAAEETAGACEESLSAVTQIKQNAHLLEVETAQVVETLGYLRELFAEAADDLKETGEGVGVVSQKFKGIAGKIDELFTKDGGITDIVNLITRLAKRTSLLALNAAIEAARAREKGRSFAAIASEIRAMASKSDSYASKIRSIIEEIQGQIESTRNHVLKTGDEVLEAAEETERTAGRMMELNEYLEGSIQIMERLKRAVEDVVAEVEALHKGAETIASAAEEAAGAASEISATVSTQMVAFKQVEEAAQLLEQAAESGEDIHRIASDVATASGETISSIEELEQSMDQTVEALEQSRQAAEISRSDAAKNAECVARCVEYANASLELLRDVQERFKKTLSEYDAVLESVRKVRGFFQENIKTCERFKEELSSVRGKIVQLSHSIRKIELAIVQTAALSISGAVEAIRVGELGSGFSDVSKDIRNLAVTSEQHLDRVIEVIDRVNEGNEALIADLNAIIITQERENQKLARLETEFAKNRRRLLDSAESVDRLTKSVEEIKTALEQSQIALDQIKEAAVLSLENTADSKRAAKAVLETVKDMRRIANRLNALAENLARGA